MLENVIQNGCIFLQILHKSNACVSGDPDTRDYSYLYCIFICICLLWSQDLSTFVIIIYNNLEKNISRNKFVQECASPLCDVKGIVHPKITSLSSFPIVFPPMLWKSMAVWLQTVWLQTSLKMSSFMLTEEETILQVWNNMRVSKRWQNFNSCVNCPFKGHMMIKMFSHHVHTVATYQDTRIPKIPKFLSPKGAMGFLGPLKNILTKCMRNVLTEQIHHKS